MGSNPKFRSWHNLMELILLNSELLRNAKILSAFQDIVWNISLMVILGPKKYWFWRYFGVKKAKNSMVRLENWQKVVIYPKISKKQYLVLFNNQFILVCTTKQYLILYTNPYENFYTTKKYLVLSTNPSKNFHTIKKYLILSRFRNKNKDFLKLALLDPQNPT